MIFIQTEGFGSKINSVCVVSKLSKNKISFEKQIQLIHLLANKKQKQEPHNGYSPNNASSVLHINLVLSNDTSSKNDHLLRIR